MQPLILLGAPIRDRAWILPRYLDAIESQEYPKKRIGLQWILNDCHDDSEAVLWKWLDRVGDKYAFANVERLDFGREDPPEKVNSRNGGVNRDTYACLATLRNKLRLRVLEGEADYLFSLDSDVIIPMDALTRLTHWKADVVAGLIRNASDDGVYNFLQYDHNRRRFLRDYRPVPAILFHVDLTGAVCLYSRAALEAGRWSVGASGEDEGMARDLMQSGILSWVDGSVLCEHVMRYEP